MKDVKIIATVRGFEDELLKLHDDAHEAKMHLAAYLRMKLGLPPLRAEKAKRLMEEKPSADVSTMSQREDLTDQCEVQ